MTVFVDASAMVPLLDVANRDYAKVRAAWDQFEQSDANLVTTNYVVVEALAVCQRRLGTAGARGLLEDIVPGLIVEWVDPDAHDTAAVALLTTNRRDLSFVDITSFQIMRRLGITRAFALDDHFREQGFEVVP